MNTMFLLIVASTAHLTATRHNREVEVMEQKLEPVHELMATMADSISFKYKLHPIGSTLGTPGGVVEVLGLKFQKESCTPVTIAEARKLLVVIANEMINQVDRTKSVKNLTKNNKFDVNNVEISVFIHDDKSNNRNHPDLSVASLHHGKLVYRTISPDPEWILKTVTSHTESYEEAKAILEGEKDQSPRAP